MERMRGWVQGGVGSGCGRREMGVRRREGGGRAGAGRPSWRRACCDCWSEWDLVREHGLVGLPRAVCDDWVELREEESESGDERQAPRKPHFLILITTSITTAPSSLSSSCYRSLHLARFLRPGHAHRTCHGSRSVLLSLSAAVFPRSRPRPLRIPGSRGGAALSQRRAGLPHMRKRAGILLSAPHGMGWAGAAERGHRASRAARAR